MEQYALGHLLHYWVTGRKLRCIRNFISTCRFTYACLLGKSTCGNVFNDCRVAILCLMCFMVCFTSYLLVLMWLPIIWNSK